MQADIEEDTAKLSSALLEANSSRSNFNRKFENSVELLSNLGNYYKQRDAATQYLIVSSIFPEKLTFDLEKFEH